MRRTTLRLICICAAACEPLGGIAGSPSQPGVDAGEAGPPQVETGPGNDAGPTCNADVQTDPLNCGTCGKICPTGPDAYPTCTKGACTLGCNKGFANCDGTAANGCETKIDDDALNCGACGHSCYGSACVAGKCQVVTVAAGQTVPTKLALDGANVYWGSAAGGAGILSCPKTGCPGLPSLVVNGDVPVSALAIANGILYYGTEANGGGVNRLQLPAGNIDPLYNSGPGFAVSLSPGAWWALDPFSVVLVRGSTAADAGTPQYLTNYDGFSHALAVDSGYVYFVKGTLPYGVVRLPLSAAPNAPAEMLYRFQQQNETVFGIALDATDVFVSEASLGRILKFPKTGLGDAGTPIVLAGGMSTPQGLAVDATYVYFAENGAGNVKRVAKAGGSVEVVASGQSSPHDVALDDTHVYWTNRAAAGAVLRVAK